MDKAKRYKVDIFGNEYTLLSDESHETVLEAAEYADRLMTQLSQGAPHADPKKIAVLAAVQLASKLLKLESQIERAKSIEADLSNYIDKELSLIHGSQDLSVTS